MTVQKHLFQSLLPTKAKAKKAAYKTRWVTREGEVIPILQLKDGHLLNIIRLLRKNGAVVLDEALQSAYAFAGYTSGEMASYYVEQDIQALEEMTVDDWLSLEVPAWDRLMQEAEQRGLPV